MSEPPTQDFAQSSLDTNNSASSAQMMIIDSNITQSMRSVKDNSEAEASGNVDAEQPPQPQVTPSNDSGDYPQFQGLQVSSPAPLMFDQPGKRHASEDLIILHPSKRMGISDVEGNIRTREKSKMWQNDRSLNKPKALIKKSYKTITPIIPDQLSQKEPLALHLNSPHQFSSTSQQASNHVFQEETQQKANSQIIEDRSSTLQSSIDALVNQISENASQTTEREKTNASKFEHQTTLLDNAIKQIRELKSKVEVLEANVIDLEEEKTSAHLTLRVHSRIIRRISGLGYLDLEVEYDKSSDSSPD